MSNPVLVEVTRGELIESVHRGAVAVADATGRLLAQLGDVETPIYPRSSLKPMQALALVESGAADAFELGDEEVALACASHSGEPMHTDRVLAWLDRIELTQSDLACGAQPSRYEPIAEAMIREGRMPSSIFNNCSGKHTGFLTVARHWDIATADYVRVEHPVQRSVAGIIQDLASVSELPWGIDGCAAPNFALSLAAFSRAAARMAAPDFLEPSRAKACRRVVDAMIKHPVLLSGTGRVCAALIKAGKGKFAVKTGAEGFFAAWIPHMGVGVAVKIDDGAARASEVAIATVLKILGVLDDDDTVRSIASPKIGNSRGAITGERRASSVLAGFMLD